MSVPTPIKKQEQAKVPNSQYVKTANKPDEGTKPAEPAKPVQPEAK